MFERKIVAAAAALLIGASLANDALAYPTTARSGASTVTGVYRPIELNLGVTPAVPLSIENCEGVCTSQLYFDQGEGGRYVGLDLYLVGTYSATYDDVPLSGNAGYWRYSLSAYDDGYGDLSIQSSQIGPSEFEILISASDNGIAVGNLTYLGGGTFTGLPYADTPLTWQDKQVLNPESESGDDWFQYYTTMAGAVMRITSSNNAGSDFVLAFQQDVQHLGPFGSPLDVDRTNTACFTDPSSPSANTATQCGSVTLTASAIPEPASLALVGLGLVGVALGRRRWQLHTRAS